MTNPASYATIRSVSKRIRGSVNPQIKLPMRITQLKLSALMLLTAAIGAGCNPSDSTAVPIVASISLTLEHDSIEIGQANTSRVIALGQHGDTLTFNPTFSSSVPSVAGINPFTGNMIALSAGTTEITATLGLRAARKTVTVTGPAVRINEVRPNGDSPGGWVELVNTSEAPANVSGWVITSKNHAAAFTFPEGLVIAPHAFLTIEEADFPEGLKSVDELHLFSRFKVQSDSFVWFEDPLTSFGRCPEGTGPLLINVAPTKTRANECAVGSEP